MHAVWSNLKMTTALCEVDFSLQQLLVARSPRPLLPHVHVCKNECQVRLLLLSLLLLLLLL
jgi:hypothetical protein